METKKEKLKLFGRIATLMRNVVRSPLGTSPERDTAVKAAWTGDSQSDEKPSKRACPACGYDITPV